MRRETTRVVLAQRGCLAILAMGGMIRMSWAEPAAPGASSTAMVAAQDTAGSQPAEIIAISAEAGEAFATMEKSRDEDYLRARERFFQLEAEQVRAVLADRLRRADALDGYWIEALQLRERQGPRLDQLWRDAVAVARTAPSDDPFEQARRQAAAEEAETAASQPAELPRPSRGASLLLNLLGPDAGCLCAEILLKGLDTDEEGWKRQIPVLTLISLGRLRQTGGQVEPMSDPRAGLVLRWTLEHDADATVAALAGLGLRSFTDPQHIAAVRELLKSAGPEHPRAGILRRTLSGLEAEYEILQHIERRAASQPAGEPGLHSSSRPAGTMPALPVEPAIPPNPRPMVPYPAVR